MSAIRFRVGDEQVRATALGLPRIRREGYIGGESYRRRARGEGPPLQQDYLPMVGLSTAVLGDGDASALLEPAAGLIMIADGRIDITTTTGVATLRRGDLLLVEGGPFPAGIRHAEGTRLVGLRLGGPWPHGGEAFEESRADTETEADGPPQSGAMRQAADGLSYFTALNGFFPDATGVWTDPRPARGLFIAELADGCVIDMHPEVLNQLVLVLRGDIELEVSGNGEVRHYRTGDVVLAADRNGEGHIDRFHGTTTLAVVVMEEDDLW